MPPGVDASLQLPPVGRGSTRTELVAEAIRTAIIEGRFPPGTMLVERRLAEGMGVSKTPVREALIRLARSGLVDVTENGGAVVCSFDAAAMLDVYDVRLQLEPWAVERAVEREGKAIVTDGGAAIELAAAAAERRDQAHMSLANRQFHRSLYAKCGNDLVRGILDDLQDRVALGTVSLLWSRGPSWRSEEEEHRSILEAIAEGDPRRACARLRDHLARARDRVAASGQSPPERR